MRRFGVIGVSVALLVWLTPLSPLPANASHADNTLDISPEFGGGVAGDNHILTAVTQDPVPDVAEVDFEVDCATVCAAATYTKLGLSGALDPTESGFAGPFDAPVSGDDASGSGDDTPSSPELSCVIPAGDTTCQVSYSRSTIGTDLVRAWIDVDRDNFSLFGIDTEEDDGLAAGLNPEPDRTDVVRVTWTAPLPAGARLDCDDDDDDDTENKAVGSTITYSCRAFNNGGTPLDPSDDVRLAGIPIDAHLDGVNNLPGPDEIVDLNNHVTGLDGIATIPFGALLNETGIADWCFFIDVDDDLEFQPSGGESDGGACDSEEPLNDEVGLDDSSNTTDVTRVTWQPPPAATCVKNGTTLDVTLATGANVSIMRATDGTILFGTILLGFQVCTDGVVPTVDNVATIDVTGTDAGSEIVSFSLVNGGLVSTAGDELELQFTLGTSPSDFDRVYIGGTSAPDEIRLGIDPLGVGIVDTNAGNASGTEIEETAAFGGGEDDVISGRGWVIGGTVIAPFGGFSAHGNSGNDLINGGDGPDQFIGHEGNDTINGHEGNDIIVSGLECYPDFGTPDPNDCLPQPADLDVVHGNRGSDSIGAGPDHDEIFGGHGRDFLNGDSGDDYAFGARGGDTLRGSSGTDLLVGARGGDFLQGGGGADRAFGGRGHDWLDGLGFDPSGQEDLGDMLFGGLHGDGIQGAEGDDVLVGNDGNDRIWGQSGDDTLEGGNISGPGDDPALPNNDDLRGGSGNDTLHGKTKRDNLLGGGGDDILLGGQGRDRFKGAAGNDHAVGSLGPDRIMLGFGDDEATGGIGHDEIKTGAGADRIFGGRGNDEIRGGGTSSNDLADALYGGPGDDFMAAGAGGDVLVGNDGNDLLSGDPGNDTLEGGNISGPDTPGAANQDELRGGEGNDALHGNTGADGLQGGEDDDLVLGGAGDDFFYEGAVPNGADVTRGGLGTDTISYLDRALVAYILQDGQANDGQDLSSPLDGDASDLGDERDNITEMEAWLGAVFPPPGGGGSGGGGTGGGSGGGSGAGGGGSGGGGSGGGSGGNWHHGVPGSSFAI